MSLSTGNDRPPKINFTAASTLLMTASKQAALARSSETCEIQAPVHKDKRAKLVPPITLEHPKHSRHVQGACVVSNNGLSSCLKLTST
eukprot:5232457-Amphidinium_carterae.1